MTKWPKGVRALLCAYSGDAEHLFRHRRTLNPGDAEHPRRPDDAGFGDYFVGFFPLVKPWVLRMDSPTSLTRWALCTSRSQIEWLSNCPLKQVDGPQASRAAREGDGVVVERENLFKRQEADVGHLLGQLLEGSPVLGEDVLAGLAESSSTPFEGFLRSAPYNQRLAVYLNLDRRPTLNG